MKKLIFTCKTITPLVMNGPYGNDPEIRPPGIKSSLRFWWRALHGHLDLNKLKENEDKIFGNTKERSKIKLRVISSNVIKKIVYEPLLPHKYEKANSPAPAYANDQNFELRIDYNENEIATEIIKNLFVISTTLGGWGKRSRRGFGSISVIAIDGKPYNSPTVLTEIFSCLDLVVPGEYKIVRSQIESVSITIKTKDQYPKLWKVEIGSKTKSLADIGGATHEVKGTNKELYELNVGSGKPRLASPIYISILPNGIPVISSLKKHGATDYSLQDTLKSKILS